LATLLYISTLYVNNKTCMQQRIYRNTGMRVGVVASGRILSANKVMQAKCVFRNYTFVSAG